MADGSHAGSWGRAFAAIIGASALSAADYGYYPSGRRFTPPTPYRAKPLPEGPCSYRATGSKRSRRRRAGKAQEASR